MATAVTADYGASGIVKGDTVQKVAHTLGYDSTTALLLCLRKAWGKRQADILRDNYCFPTISETRPAAISGPTGRRETALRLKQCPPAAQQPVGLAAH